MKFLENKAQSLAVEATEGPVLLISCPGSGKTTTLIRRIHRILKNGAVPGSILMVTFTNAASRDMEKRYFELYGTNPGITFQTIHSLAFNILRAEGRYDRDSLLSVQEEREFFLHLLRKNRWISDPFELSQAVMTEISGLRNNDTPLKGYQPLTCSRDVFEQLYYAYARFKEERRRIDFDDILFEARRLLSVNRDALAKWQRRFRYILCDEYQDTNVIQKDILTLLAGQDRNLCVVGDDDQSIYAFRGARPDIMLAFPGEFPGANVIKMGDNYRSALTIVQTADRLIRHNRKRFSKECRSVRGQNGAIGSVTYLRYPSRQKEAEGLVRLIRKLTEAGTELKDMAVLFRTNRQIRLIQGNLERSSIPSCSTEAIRNLYDGWIFRDIVSYARLSFGDGSKDDMLRVLNHPARYLKEEAFAGADFSYRGMRRAIAYLKADAYWKYQAADDALRDWIDLLGPGSLTEDDPPAKLFELLTGPRSIRYQEYLDDYASFRNTDPDEFYEELDELKADALMFRSLRDWFRHAALSVGEKKRETPHADENSLILTTMHKAKGLEWKAVFIADFNKDVIPGRQAKEAAQIEEERRLLYVAMTRAKDSLFLMNSSARESMFLRELKPDPASVSKDIPPASLKGRTVRHSRFGDGVITGLGPGRVRVTFREGMRDFRYPETFNSEYLKVEDGERFAKESADNQTGGDV